MAVLHVSETKDYLLRDGEPFFYLADTVWAAFLGALVVSVVNMVLSFVFREELKSKRDRKHD